MKPLLTIFILAAFLHNSNAAPPTAQTRTLMDINAIPMRVLKGSISPKFYKSLMISPIQGWVVVRANVSGTRLFGMKVIHSELNGVYDALALKLAKEAQIAGYYSIASPNVRGSVLLHLLIYQIADGTMALSFPQFDEPGGDQMEYFGCAKLAVLKGNGKWTEIKGPEGLQGKGWAVRATGMANELRIVKKLETGLMALTW